MFNPCRHIRSIDTLAAKSNIKETMLLSGNILTEFYCLKCNKLVASVVRQG